MYLWSPYMFASTFITQAGVAALSAVVLMGVRLPLPNTAKKSGGRPLSQIVRQPRFIVAATCGAVSYLVMNFLVTAAPLAMRMCGHSQEISNNGLHWPLIPIYAPRLDRKSTRLTSTH